MSHKLDRNSAQAFANLRSNPNFLVVLEWLKEYGSKETQVCVEGEGKTLHQAQGAVKTLKRIQEAYDEAPTTLQKIVNNL